MRAAASLLGRDDFFSQVKNFLDNYTANHKTAGLASNHGGE